MLHEVKFSTRLVSVLITSEVPAHKQQLIRKVREGMQAGMRLVLKIQVIIANFLILTTNIVN